MEVGVAEGCPEAKLPRLERALGAPPPGDPIPSEATPLEAYLAYSDL